MPALVVVEERAQRVGKLGRVAGSTSTAAVPSSPTTSGNAPARLAISGVAQAIASTAGIEKPSYSDGHDGDLSRCQQLGDARRRTGRTTNRTTSPRSRSVTAARDRTVRVRLADDNSSTSRPVRSLATASSSTFTPLIGLSELDTATIRPGTRGAVGGRKVSVSTPIGTTRMTSGLTLKSRAMSAAELVETVTIDDIRRATRPCIRVKRVPAALAEPLPQIRCVGDLDDAVDADRMMHGRDQRQAGLGQREHAVAERLVVVHDVEVARGAP